MSKKITLIGILLAVLVSLGSCTDRKLFSKELKIVSQENHPTTDAYDGWRLGIQAWTFNRFTFYEAVDKTASLGLDWIEAYPGQRLSKEKSGVNFNHDMPQNIRDEVKKRCRRQTRQLRRCAPA